MSDTTASEERPVALSMAGSDSSGGAGIQIDLRMFSALGVYGTTVITALTAQNPAQVAGVVGVKAEFVTLQANTIFKAFPVAALKTGMLWSNPIIECVADLLSEHPHIQSVVDPVMIASSGAKLLADEAIEAYRMKLLPRCTLMTPNIDEASVLLDGRQITRATQVQAAQQLSEAYGCAVLLKGGHLSGDPVDVLWAQGKAHSYKHPRIMNVNTHGSGCALSAAITAHLCHGHGLCESVDRSLKVINQALTRSISPAKELALMGLERCAQT